MAQSEKTNTPGPADDSTILKKLSLLIDDCEGRLCREAADCMTSVLDIVGQWHELADGLGPVGHIEFLKNALHVVLYSERTDVQDRGNFWVGFTLGYPFQHFLFSLTQVVLLGQLMLCSNNRAR